MWNAEFRIRSKEGEMSSTGRSQRVRALVSALVMIGALSATSVLASEPTDGDRQIQQELAAVGDQEAFTRFLAHVVEHFGSDVVDHSWHQDHGVVVVSESAYESVKRQASSAGVRIVVEAAPPHFVAFGDRSTVELAVLEELSTLGVESMAARYEPDTRSVVVTVWSDEGWSVPESITARIENQPEISERGISVVVVVETADDAPQAGSGAGDVITEVAEDLAGDTDVVFDGDPPRTDG
ncbi:MAG: hypothetical protein Q4G64_00895 [bacterium]|nr:hypothetical protein [bacterium]